MLAMLEADAVDYQRHFERNVREHNPAVGTAAELWIISLFGLGLMNWRSGAIGLARHAFERCALAYVQRQEAFSALQHIREIREAFGSCVGSYPNLARVANYLIGGEKLDAPAPDSILPTDPRVHVELAYPILRYCLDGDESAIISAEHSRHLWAGQGYSPSLFQEWDFYRSVLTGEWRFRDPQEMFDRHAQIYAARRKSKNGELLDGEGKFNDLVVDYIFAAILKKIGWRGEYQHAWPETGVPVLGPSQSTTHVPPHVFIGSTALELPRVQLPPFQDYPVARAISLLLGQASKVGSDVGRIEMQGSKDTASLGLMGVTEASPDYKLFSAIQFETLTSRHLGVAKLADLQELGERTQDLRRTVKMDPDLIVLSVPDEMLQWDKPNGGEFVYRLSDRRVYLAESDALSQSGKVERAARSGLTVWPSLASFLIWYAGAGQDQHG